MYIIAPKKPLQLPMYLYAHIHFRAQEAMDMEFVPIFKKRHTSHILLQNRSCATFADYFFPLPYQLGVSAAATALAF